MANKTVGILVVLLCFLSEILSEPDYDEYYFWEPSSTKYPPWMPYYFKTTLVVPDSSESASVVVDSSKSASVVVGSSESSSSVAVTSESPVTKPVVPDSSESASVVVDSSKSASVVVGSSESSSSVAVTSESPVTKPANEGGMAAEDIPKETKPVEETHSNGKIMMLLEMIDSKINQNSKKLDETKQSIEKNMEKKFDEHTKRIDKLAEKLDTKLEHLATEVHQQMKNFRDNMEKLLEEVKIDLKKIENETMKRRVEIQETREGVEKRICQIHSEVQEYEQQVKNINDRWQQAIVSYHEYINEKLQEREGTILEKVVARLEKATKKLEELLERQPKVACTLHIMTDDGPKFLGNIRRIHPKDYIISLQNRIRQVKNIEDIKDILRLDLLNVMDLTSTSWPVAVSVIGNRLVNIGTHIDHITIVPCIVFHVVYVSKGTLDMLLEEDVFLFQNVLNCISFT